MGRLKANTGNKVLSKNADVRAAAIKAKAAAPKAKKMPTYADQFDQAMKLRSAKKK